MQRRLADLPVVNVRSAGVGLSGVQRYTLELCTRLQGHVTTIRPRHTLGGTAGHLWEQLVLPFRVGERVLWSPANAGPLAVDRQVLTLHDAAVFDHPDGFNPVYASWYRVLLPRLVQRVAKVIAVSEFTRERVIATTGAPPERVVVIHNGVGKAGNPVAAAAISAVCRRYGIVPNAYVLAVGTLEPRKNVHALVQAWSRVAPQVRSDVQLVIVGAEGSPRVFRAHAELPVAPRVVRTGAVGPRDLEALYAGSLGLVNVSFYEGFGLPPLEAAAAGVPVIASNIPAFREVLQDSAIFVEPSDLDGIGAAIVEVVHDDLLRERLRAAGVRNARRFSWDAAAERTLEALHSV